MAIVNARVTEYQVSCLPQDGTARSWGGVFDVHVTWSGIGELWAVRANGRVYDAEGVEQYEPIPSERDKEFLARFRHDQETAMRVAARVAPTITVNGTTALQAAERLAGAVGRPMSEAEFQPGTYVVTFDRIGRQRPGPLTLTATDADDLAAQIHGYADARTASSDIFVCVDPPEPGRSIATGWITAGGRDAGRFTWRAHDAVAAVIEIEED